jgi:hypothetical protein
MDRNGTDLEDEDRPPIILKPTTPTSGCPAFGDWEIAWAPDGYDDSTFACVVGGSTECAVCSGNTGTTNPSTNCMDNLDFTDCHCSYNVTISGVASTADPNDCSVPWNTDHGDLNKSGSGVWTKTNSTQDYKIFCSNSSTYTGLTDGNYYWCLLMEYQIYPELGKLYCRLTAATDCDFAGTYTPHSVTRYGCTYTSNGTVTISEA